MLPDPGAQLGEWSAANYAVAFLDRDFLTKARFLALHLRGMIPGRDSLSQALTALCGGPLIAAPCPQETVREV